MRRPSAVVTGAGSGIGRETARMLAGEGFRVLLVGRRPGPLEDVAAEIGSAVGDAAQVFVGDVGERPTAEGMIDRCVAWQGGIDALVNNAGFAPFLPIEETSPDVIETAFRVNAMGPAWAIARAWPHFRAQRAGCVVNISTLGTVDPFIGFYAYAASKAAVNLLARSCAKEGAAIGVRAFAVAPGAVETPMLRGLFDCDRIRPEDCLSASEVARVVVDCILGRRDGENGGTITLMKS